MYALEMSKDMESVLVFSECSQVQETQMLLHWPGDASPRRGMEHTKEAPDGAPSPRRQLLSFPVLPCNPRSLLWLRVPKCTQTLCLRSQSFSQILQTLKHRKCDGAGPQGKKCLCSVWGTACWGLAGRGTPKDSEKSSDGKGLPACGSDFGLSVMRGRRRWTPRKKGWGSYYYYPRRTRFNGRNMKPKNKINKIWHSLLYGNFLNSPFEVSLQVTFSIPQPTPTEFLLFQ